MTDNQLIIVAFILFWLTLFFLILNSNRRLRAFIISFIFHIIYSSYLLHGLKYKSEYGGGLVWWFLLLLILSCHSVLNVILIILKILRPIKNNIIYKDNFQTFLNSITDAFVLRIALDIDHKPMFDKNLVPFDFHYCNSVDILTDKGNFRIQTSMTDMGVETFWILNNFALNNSQTLIQINSTVKNIAFETGYKGPPYKIKIKFDTTEMFIYSGELYNEGEKGIKYNKNDEMLLVFQNSKDAGRFESLIN